MKGKEKAFTPEEIAYQVILGLVLGFNPTTWRDWSGLKSQLETIAANEALSPEEKIFAWLEAFSEEHHRVINSIGGSNSRLAKEIEQFCVAYFDVQLQANAGQEIIAGGRIDRMLGATEQKPVAVSEKKREKQQETPKNKWTSFSASFGSTKKVTGGRGSLSMRMPASEDPSQLVLRQFKEDSRVGQMFGRDQFCYAPKPEGVEPGFIVIDLDEAFFDDLPFILLPEENPLKISLQNDLAQVHDGNLESKKTRFRIIIENISPKFRAAFQEAIKDRVAENPALHAWMYKLDQHEQLDNKKRIRTNNEALREFTGTKLASHFSAHNQTQKIVGVRGETGTHFELACAWKQGMQTFKSLLYGGGAPDYQGVLVEDPEADIKKSKVIAGLGKNLIFGIAIGDRDGIGKNAQNKGHVNGVYYGFDYGKPFEFLSVAGNVRDDFSFRDPMAAVPKFFKDDSLKGVARHGMYRNYSVFYDTALSERMEGVHILRKMITGENPSEAVMESYEGLVAELQRIEEHFPSSEKLMARLRALRQTYPEKEKRVFIDRLLLQIAARKLSQYDHYFAESKIDLLENSLNTDIDPGELETNLSFIDYMAARAAENNAHILRVFDQRMGLTRQQIDFLDHLEKIASPTSILSHDGEVLLNHLRIDPPEERVAFQLRCLDDGNYELTTKKKYGSIFGYSPKVSKEGSRFTFNLQEFRTFREKVEENYSKIKQEKTATAMQNPKVNKDLEAEPSGHGPGF